MEFKYWKFYLAEILRGFWLTLPITTIFYLSKNFSYYEIGIFESALALVIFFTEVPTGILSDRIVHKKISILGFLLYGVALIVIAFFYNFWIFLSAFIFIGLAESLISGSYSSLLYEHVQKLNGNYSKIKLETSIFKGVSVVTASLLGAYLFTIDSNSPFYFYGIILIILSILLIFINTKEYKKSRSFKNILIKSFRIIKKPDLFYFILYTIIIFGLLQVFIALIQRPIILTKGFFEFDLGWIMAVMFGVGWSFPYFFKNIKVSFNRLFLIGPILGVLFFLILFTNHFSFFIIMLLIRVFKEIHETFSDIILHKNIPSSSRASVLSIQSSIMNIVSALLMFISGYLISYFNFNLVIIIISILFLVFSIFFLINNYIKK